MARAGQRRYCGSGVIGAGSKAEGDVFGGAEYGAQGDDRGEVLGVILAIPAVAQEGVGDARSADRLLGILVLGRELHVRGLGVQDARIYELLGAGLLAGVDHCLVLPRALPDLRAGDQEYLFRARQGRSDRGRLAIELRVDTYLWKVPTLR